MQHIFPFHFSDNLHKYTSLSTFICLSLLSFLTYHTHHVAMAMDCDRVPVVIIVSVDLHKIFVDICAYV